MIIEQFIRMLAEKEVYISVSDGNLKIKTTGSSLTDEMIGSISSRKAEILEFYDAFNKKSEDSSIPNTGLKEYYSLSSAQRRMYFLQAFDQDSLAYNMPYVLRLEGKLDKSGLEQAFQGLVDRHEVLRTTIEEIEGKGVQKIQEGITIPIIHYIGKEEDVAGIVEGFIRPFDLREAPLIRVGLIEVSSEDHVLLVDMHHIISDGASQGILIKEFMSLYAGEVPQAPQLHYKDYAEWQSSPTHQEQLSASRAYWQEVFEEEVVALNLPSDHARPKAKDYSGAIKGFSLDVDQTSQLETLSQEQGATMFMTVLSLMNVLLSKLSHQEDIVIGTPTAGRNHADLEGMIGMFVNTLPLRNYPKGDLSFKQFIQLVKENTLEGFHHQAYQYEDLVEDLQVVRDASRNPLFDVMFSYQNFDGTALTLPGLKLTSYPSNHSVSKFDLTLTGSTAGDHLYLSFEYSTELFEATTIERFISYFQRITDQVMADPEVKLSAINVLSKEEQDQLLNNFNDTKVTYPTDATVVDLFDRQANQLPEAVALFQEDTSLTYKDLQEKVDAVAARLTEEGMNPGSLIGLMTDRSFDMIAGILGILKSGCAYLPIDPKFPQSRVDYMLEDSGASLLLCSPAHEQTFDLSIKTLTLDSINETNTQQPIENKSHPESLAYVMYTSGSTGLPKGVQIAHQSLTNLLHGLQARYPLTQSDRYLLKTNYTFDVSMTELMGWFVGGGSLVLLPQGGESDMDELIHTIDKHEVTHLNFSPSVFSVFTDRLQVKGIDSVSSLRYIFLAGEALQHSQVERFNNLGTAVKLENLYGPTEGTVYSTAFSLSNLNGRQVVPIGKPLDNVRMLILDSYGQLQPRGVVGELCIGGQGLAVGYMNRKELTEEKFIPDPYHVGERLYRTGDLASWEADGTIRFLGRQDDQIKIRGFRVELGEIEQQLLSYEGINEGIVLAKGAGSDKYLVAYYVSSEPVEAATLRGHLSAQLPEYMLPTYYVHLASFPVTANGKLDRKALPDPEIGAGEDYMAPSNETEQQLVQVWSEILELDADKISVTKSFFELGGNSLKAMVLVGQLSRVLNVSVSVKDFFNIQTVRDLSEHISGLAEQTHVAIKKAPEKAFYSTSSAQQRMFFLYEFDKNSIAYNMPQVFRLEGAFDRVKLESAFRQMIERHEILHSSIQILGDYVVQQVNDNFDFAINYYKSKESEISDIIKAFIRPFVLEEAPLIRVGLIDIGIEDHVLMVDMHHIVSDGVSQGVLIEDFIQLYTGGELESLELQYKDYAEWQRSEAHQEELALQKSFWMDEFAEEVSVLNLPTDRIRPKLKGHDGKVLAFNLDKADTEKLKSLSNAEGTTMFMTLLSVFNVLLSKLTNQQDIVVGTPTAGRNHADLEGMIGMFVNTLALRNTPTSELSFRDFLQTVKQKTLNCFDNQSYQYEDLVEALNIPRDTSRNPLFDTMFSYRNFETSTSHIPGLNLKPFSSDFLVTKFDMTLSVVEFYDELFLDFRYSTALFEQGTVQRFIDYFKRIVNLISIDPDLRIGEIDILSEVERTQLLRDFNDTDIPNTSEKTIVEMFEEQVSQTPDQSALVFKGVTLSYQDLNNRANQIAHRLRESGVGQESIVGVMVERSFDLITSILGVLKAGGAYMPIDASYPTSRVIHMLQDSKTKLLIVDTHSSKKGAEHFGGQLFHINEFNYLEEQTPNLPLVNKPDDLFYLIYTSGSTGKPKGAMLTHGNLANLIYNDYQHTGINFESVLQYATIGFDRHFQEIFSALLSGGKLVLVPEDDRLNFRKVFDLMADQEVRTFWMSPSVLNHFFEDPELIRALNNVNSLEHIVTSGEQVIINEGFKEFLHEAKVHLHNHYGPSETHVVTTNTIAPSENIPSRPGIGQPITNTSIYILDIEKRLQALGVPGELYIGGVQVGKGYWGNTELTEEKFIPDPYRAGERLYRTGDLASWEADGMIRFLGRQDDQIKIRGFRVELGEIEQQLLSYEGINEGIVLAKGEGSDKYLVAYYVSSEPVEAATLRGHLSAQLPEYMLPTYFVHLASFPVTANGKLDRKALPDPEIGVGEDYMAPSNETEQQLVQVWSEILELEPETISVDQSFFALGGHSLKAMVLVNRLSQVLDLSVPVKDLFTYQDIRSLSNHLMSLTAQTHVAIPGVPMQEYYATSSAQQRMYFLQAFDRGSLAYNMPYVLKLEGKLNKSGLEQAFQGLVDRHEVLRTTIEVVEGKVVQKVREEVAIQISHYTAAAEDIVGIVEGFIRPFDLRDAPLIRVGLIELNPEDHVLLVDMHHIISDGASQGILIKEFMSLYAGEVPQAPQLHYKDYAEWQSSPTHQEQLSASRAYWQEVFEEEIVALNLPSDHARPKAKDYSGAIKGFSLDADQTSQLEALSQEQGATMFMTVLSLMNVLLSKLSHEEDIVIGTPTAGRNHADLEGMIGMFVNTLPLRNYPKGDLSFKQFIQLVKENTLEGFHHQAYQYEDLVEDLQVVRDASRNPLFDVMFSYQNFDGTALTLPGLKLTSYPSNHSVSKFDLTLTGSTAGDHLYLSFEYSTELFEATTIDRFISYFQRIVDQVLADPEVKLSAINVLSKEEQDQLLNNFNDTKVTYPTDETVVDLFGRQANQLPEAVALFQEDTSLTYKELQKKVDAVAARLTEEGMNPGSLIGLMTDRSFDMIAGILGILKSGCAYLPIDPKFPQSRVDYMLEDSGASLLLCSPAHEQTFDLSIKTLTLDSINETNTQQPIENKSHPESLAYVMYTSGSTGLPKGVQIAHQSLTNLQHGLQARYPLTQSDRYLLKTNYTFDVSMTELMGWFVGGGSLVLLPQGGESDMDELIHTIDKHEVTHLNFSPSVFSVFTDRLKVKGIDSVSSLRYIFLAGEALQLSQVERFNNLGTAVKLENLYGPTEGTVYSTAFSLSNLNGRQVVPIGKPLDNVRMLILDSYGQLQPRGVVGELCIGGQGLAVGYMNREELTEEKFIPDPYHVGERLYRTGDLASWEADGTIRFLGRQDDQIKIRGFRVELGEIEQQLLSYEGINEGIVLAKGEGSDKYLVAYYVSSEPVEAATLRGHLSARLPEYMLPTYYVHLISFPVTANGKLDRKALPDPEIGAGENYVAPTNETEQQLVQVWSQTLEIDESDISVNANFFEIGGHSLKLIQLQQLLKEQLGLEASIQELFRYPTITSFKDFIDHGEEDLAELEDEATQEISEMGDLLKNFS
ncbi:MAG: amino acid adenylation domain-containing protein [Cytophagales bacterium]|nr:amino acid adenylation domain-containing protein [Cytophagales bacterium]